MVRMLDRAALPSTRTAPPSWPMLLRPLSMSIKVLLPERYNLDFLATVKCHWPNAPVRGTAVRGMPMQLLLALVTCRLARTGRSHYGHEFVGVQLSRDVQHHHFAFVAATEALPL